MQIPEKSAERYKELLGIPPEEWQSFFDHQNEPWSKDDDEYIREWFPRVNTLEIAYALGRTPWTVTSHANRLGIKKAVFGQRVCRFCGKSFGATKSNQLYCTTACTRKHQVAVRRIREKQKQQMTGA